MYLEFTYKLRPLKGYDLKVSYTRNYRFSKKGLEGSLKKGRRWGTRQILLAQDPQKSRSGPALHYKATQVSLAKAFVILYFGQVTWMQPELAPSLQSTTLQHWEVFEPQQV
ncbi:uncharacterized protein TNCV_2595791 [Trichonephila clavipes]|nr:uncharacterized protein TNCV_2595791 [Trichonephila clavipes]